MTSYRKVKYTYTEDDYWFETGCGFVAQGRKKAQQIKVRLHSKQCPICMKVKYDLQGINFAEEMKLSPKTGNSIVDNSSPARERGMGASMILRGQTITPPNSPTSIGKTSLETISEYDAVEMIYLDSMIKDHKRRKKNREKKKRQKKKKLTLK